MELKLVLWFFGRKWQLTSCRLSTNQVICKPVCFLSPLLCFSLFSACFKMVPFPLFAEAFEGCFVDVAMTKMVNHWLQPAVVTGRWEWWHHMALFEYTATFIDSVSLLFFISVVTHLDPVCFVFLTPLFCLLVAGCTFGHICWPKQSDIANYWPGMHTTAFSVLPEFPCKNRYLIFMSLLHKSNKAKEILCVFGLNEMGESAPELFCFLYSPSTHSGSLHCRHLVSKVQF